MNRPEPGTVIDGFELGDCLHSGSMAWLYRVRYADGRPDPGFPMVMKIPRMSAGDGAENIVGFEVEQQILQGLDSPYVPKLVAVGDLARQPYLVMEYITGQVLEAWLEPTQSPPVNDVIALGIALAQAVHDLHQHNVVHLDLKPANVLVRESGEIALLDFGLSWHAHYPDLLAEPLHPAVGSPAWIAPEQVVGVRGDPRSDVFAIGVMLYQLLTGVLPFGAPLTRGGLRQRLWMSPRPLRALRADVPAWLQEVVLRCLEPEAALRYPSAAHLVFDLQHPTQVRVTERGAAQQPDGFWFHLKRWVHAIGMQYRPSPLPERQISEVPIVMVAVPHRDVSDATLYSLRQAAARSLGTRPGARLACVTVISPSQISTVQEHSSETTVHRQYLAQLKQWARPLEQPNLQWSCHVLESTDVAQALVDYARGNHVSVIVIGAATHGLKMQHLVATVSIKVAMEAPCTVVLVKQALPFEQLAAASAAADEKADEA